MKLTVAPNCSSTRPVQSTTSLMPIKTLLLDLGDVLFNWSCPNTPRIPPSTLSKIVQSLPWLEYERGTITRVECYRRCSELFALHVEEIHAVFMDARDTLQANRPMVELVQHLVAQSKGTLRVYAVSNIGTEDWEELYGKPC